MPSRYRVNIRYGPSEGRRWDAFLKQVPAGHHVQTAAWARMKLLHGWRPVRIEVDDGCRLLAGGQLLAHPLTRLPFIGAIAYLPKGPVCTPGHQSTVELIVARMQSLYPQMRLRYVAVQSPENCCWDPGLLVANGFRSSRITLGPVASVRIDLTLDEGALLRGMKPKKRYNIRHGIRKGVRVRRTTAKEIESFHRLLESTAARRDFVADTVEYFRTMLRQFGSMARLFFAERAGEVIAGALVVSFGEVTYLKRLAWSGATGNCHPNEVLIWELIRWSKARGDRVFDFEGISLNTARQLLHQSNVGMDLDRSVSSFKIGFGGDVVIYPHVYEQIPNKVISKIYHMVGKEKYVDQCENIFMHRFCAWHR